MSVWDQMAHRPGKIFQGQTGDVACDHYHRLDEDLDLMAEIGLNAYRFSFSWPRILPDGIGAINEKGLDLYDRLIDGLLERGIAPWGTLFHWDYPLALYHRGGWLHPDSPKWFADYTEVLAKRFGDRVTHWMTLNEPSIFIGHGHIDGDHAPGLKLPNSDIARIVHQVLLSHGKAVQVLRAHCAAAPTIGWAPAVGVSAVSKDFETDAGVVAAAREDQLGFDPADTNIVGRSAVWCDPVFLGKYPENFISAFGHNLPKDWEADLGTISTPIDFCGMNIYFAWHYWNRNASGAVQKIHESALGDGYPRTLFGWPVTPEALYWGPKFFNERYNVPIVITENGMSGHDWVSLDGQIHDPQRIDFTARYLSELQRASADGVDVRGYFHWSLMDNFEWAAGYKHRFGLIHVDFKTGARTFKDSARWYSKVIATNGKEYFSDSAQCKSD
jgi:beta-glucosidase